MERANRKWRLSLVSALILQLTAAQEPRPRTSSELRERIDRLSVLGTVLYVAAHPDDENTAFLATMVHGRHLQTAYLAMTRGEGGQNLIGPEQGALLGMIRTQELLAARRVDGAMQYFTRAIDFGFSKTTKETIELWGRDSILADVVHLIRRIRPDVIVNRFTPEQGGHGNHTASAVFAREGFEAAGDLSRFNDPVRFPPPWKAKRLVWNGFRFQQSDRPSQPAGAVTIDLGRYSPLLGRSFSELAGEARTMHKSQGFGAAQNRGEFTNYFVHVAGDSAKQDLFDGIDMTWRRVAGGEVMIPLIDSLRMTFDDRHPEMCIPQLLRIDRALRGLPASHWVRIKRMEVAELIVGCAGLWADIFSGEAEVVPGDTVAFTLSVVNRIGPPMEVLDWSLSGAGVDRRRRIPLQNNVAVRDTARAVLPADIPISQPYWLGSPADGFAYANPHPSLSALPESPSPFLGRVRISILDDTLEVRLRARYRIVDPVDGEKFLPVEVKPMVLVSISPAVGLFPDLRPRNVDVRVLAARSTSGATVKLRVPMGWRTKPEKVDLPPLERGNESAVSFSVEPTRSAANGTLTAEVKADGRTFSWKMERAQYDHIPPQFLYAPASGQLVRLELKSDDRRIGYVMGAGDEVPEGLRLMGYNVDLLTDSDLLNGNLAQYRTIMAGVRAFNTRPILRSAKSRLMRFMETGGTFVVQYVTSTRGESDAVGPYSMTIGRERVTDETAEIRVVGTKSRVLNYPNQITADDYKGWIQERGLYFAQEWSEEYDPVFELNDPGESPKRGALLVAKVGKGSFAYTGLAFFRQIPAGVPGAYRLLANLVSLSQQ